MKPPSIVKICPVMYEATGRQRKTTMADMSLGSPMRPAGVWEIIASTIFFPSSIDSCIAIAMHTDIGHGC